MQVFSGFLLALLTEPISVGAFLTILFIMIPVAGLIRALIKRTPREPVAGECTWDQRLYSWGKRHIPLLLGIVSFLLVLFGPIILRKLTFWGYDAAPILPSQVNVDSDQENAVHQANGSKTIGTIFGIWSGGTFLFSMILVVVWFVLHYIVPGGPTWAKKYYTLGFKNPGDEGYEEEYTLTTANKHSNWNKVWLTLCWLYAFCICIAAFTPS
jgi:hypothetical protein